MMLRTLLVLTLITYIQCTGHYTIVGSKQIRPNSEYHVAVNYHDGVEPNDIRLTIQDEDKYKITQDVTVLPYSTKVVEFKTGDMVPGSYKLLAEGLSGIVFKNETDINLNVKTISVLVQTDKAMYKPSDNVKFRVLLLDSNLKPAAIDGKMLVYITDGNSNRIKQWTDAKTVSGVFSEELQLSEHPVLGNWMISIEVNGEKKTKGFEVAEYVLPIFEVTIVSPVQPVYKDGVVNVQIVATYTYGQPVKGESVVTIQPKIYGSWQPVKQDLISQKTVKIDGKGIVAFDMKTDMKIEDEYQREYDIDATVEEALTGRKQSAKLTITIYQHRYTIRKISDAYTYKPGLPFDIAVQVANNDGSPVIDNVNQLNISYGQNWNESDYVSQLYKLDSNGIVKLSLTFPENASGISVNAQYLELKEGIGYFSRATSTNGAYLQAIVQSKKPVINEEVTVKVLSTEPMSYFTYQILGRGDILDSGTVTVPDRTSHQFKFLATFSMVPKAQMIVYFLKDGEIVSERQEIAFSEEFPNFINLDLSAEQAKPGQAIDLTISTSPNSFVGLLGIDRSVRILKSGNDLSRSEISEELGQYNRDYYSPVWGGRFFPSYYGGGWEDFSNAEAVVMSNAKEPPRSLNKSIFISIGECGQSRNYTLGRPWYYLAKGGGALIMPMAAPTVSLGSSPSTEVAAPTVRKDFPETWIWDEFTIDWIIQEHVKLVLDSEFEQFAISAFKPENLNEEKLRATVFFLTKKKQPRTLDSTSTRSPIENEIAGRDYVLRKQKIDIGPPLLIRTNTRPPLAGPYAFSRIPKSKWKRKRVLLDHVIRDTWLFVNLQSTGLNGTRTLNKTVPDTITSWEITGFSIDPVTGLGLTKNPTTLKVFQSFFISLNLPYSIKRGEVVALSVVVFNYFERLLKAEVTLHNENQEFEFVEATKKETREKRKIELYRRKRISINSNDGTATSFMIRPLKVGLITIKVTATSSQAADAIERILPCEPEGVPQYNNTAVFIDLREKPEQGVCWPIDVPDNAVENSTRIEVSAIGDILGITIQNLDSLIKMPYGCGEQNMLNFVPNIVVLDYLQASGQLTPAIEAKTKKYMESGYQRELTYKHPEGSFSAFGTSDANGSTWLTAFVAKSFRHAAIHIDIEEKIIHDALKWLQSVQAVNGSFPEVGHVSHTDMQGGAGQGIALTAYTAITFLENLKQFPNYLPTINKALDYILKNLPDLKDIYAYALASYAFELAEHTAKDYVFQTFNANATIEGDRKWWDKPVPASDAKNIWYSKPNSVNIEMTSYGLLTILHSGNFTDGLPVMKWLLSQRNAEGGFQSTQDTVVGLQALAKFAAKISSKNNNIQLLIEYGEDGGEFKANVNADNSLILQKFTLPADVQDVGITATGSGVALVQMSYQYNIDVTGAWPRFTLDPSVDKSSTTEYLRITVCTAFIPAGGVNVSNMAVMEVEFPSGFTADLDRIPSIESSENVKMVETKKGDTVVVIYFDNIGTKELCPTLDAYRSHKVAEQKPAAVKVYDYYDNSRQARMFYQGLISSLCDICDDCDDECNVTAEKLSSNNDDATATSAARSGAISFVVGALSFVAVLLLG